MIDIIVATWSYWNVILRLMIYFDKVQLTINMTEGESTCAKYCYVIIMLMHYTKKAECLCAYSAFDIWKSKVKLPLL